MGEIKVAAKIKKNRVIRFWDNPIFIKSTTTNFILNHDIFSVEFHDAKMGIKHNVIYPLFLCFFIKFVIKNDDIVEIG